MVNPSPVGNGPGVHSVRASASGGPPSAPVPMLLLDAGERRCALPLAPVRETMRPLPVEPLEDAPRGVLGLAVIRGEPVPVVDLAALLGEPTGAVQRFVAISVDERPVALAVGAVRGVLALPSEALRALPPLLDQADRPAVAAIASYDAALWLVLGESRLLPETARALIDRVNDGPFDRPVAAPA